MPVAILDSTTQLDVGNYQGVEVRASSELSISFVYTDWINIRLFEAIE